MNRWVRVVLGALAGIACVALVTAVIFGIWFVTAILGAIAPTPGPNGGGGQAGGGQYITVGNVKFGLAQGWQLINGPDLRGTITATTN